MISFSALHRSLHIFEGGTGGLDNWLATQAARETIASRLANLPNEPLSCSQLNQLLALSHVPEMAQGFFKYYWCSSDPDHPYKVDSIPFYDQSYSSVDQILTLDQLVWGLYRFYVDALLFYGAIANAYSDLRLRTMEQLSAAYKRKQFDSREMLHRGPMLPLHGIPEDKRYLIAELACKSLDPRDEPEAELLFILRGAWAEHMKAGGGKITTKQLLSNFVDDSKRQGHLFAADDMLGFEANTEDELIARYMALRGNFDEARRSALQNTELYLSMAHDLDVYVATSMRTREQFREMARKCEFIFNHPAVRHLHLRYFDPTLSAARGHEDKGLIECLMVKCAKVLIYTAGTHDSYGKDAEAAMALSLGKPVIFLCDEEGRRRFFREVHPLSRLIDFQTGVAVGAIATSSIEEIPLLLSRIFDNSMEYDLERPEGGRYRLVERRTRSTVRLQTDHRLLRETFWNCYHRRSTRRSCLEFS